MRHYVVALPLPPSINKGHTVGKKRRATTPKKEKERIIRRSDEYDTWIQLAWISFRKHFPYGIEHKLQGRLHADYIFCFPTHAGDTDNRIKIFQDFLQGKFFDNDSQIDSFTACRRTVRGKESLAVCIIREIEDRREEDPNLEFQRLIKSIKENPT